MLAPALALALSVASTGAALPPLAPPPPAASGASGRIDPAAATRAYLAQVPPDVRARSDSYFEGGYWLQLWDFLWDAAALLLLLRGGFSARLRERAERVSRRPALQVALYWTQFLLAYSALTFPLTFYEEYVREHRYGLSNLSLGGWLGDWAKGLLLGVVLGGPLVVALYAVVRRARERWWLWASAVAVAFLALVMLIGPVAITPIFNHPTRLADARVVEPVLSLARASGIPASEVWQIDASRQSTRVSANVSGLLGTLRITLNDNLLLRCSLPEIEAVMAHEMGHYVLHHVEQLLAFNAAVFVAGLALVASTFERLRRRFARWDIRGVADPAGLPLAMLVATTYLFLLTPVRNGVVRGREVEADLFGLHAAGQPDGFAQVALKLADYRKLDPGPLEEALFYDHPSGRARVFAAMRWKAEHAGTWSSAPSPARPGGTAALDPPPSPR